MSTNNKNDNNKNDNNQKEKKLHPATAIPLDLVLDFFGADPNQDRQKGKWKLHGYGNIAVKGSGWYNLNEEVGGRGAITLTMHALGYPKIDREGFKKAIELLEEEFKDAIDWDNPDFSAYKMNISKEKKEFNPPLRYDRYIPNVKEYLTGDRQIPAYIIDKLVGDGLIYADKYKNSIFLGPESAEVRSTVNEFGSGFSGCCEGSDTENSGFIAPRMKEPESGKTILALGEAAIDALSYLALHPEAHVISSNGAGRFVLQYKLAREAIENNSDIVFAFDADYPGDKAAQKVFNSFYLKEYLTRSYGLKADLVDEWLIDKKLKVILPKKDECNSDDMFFGQGLPFRKSSVTFMVDPEHTRETIHSKIPFDKEITIPMHPKGVNILLNKMNLKRSRPILTKDWNEEWKARPKNMSIEDFKIKQARAATDQFNKKEISYRTEKNIEDDTLPVEKASVEKTRAPAFVPKKDTTSDKGSQDSEINNKDKSNVRVPSFVPRTSVSSSIVKESKPVFASRKSLDYAGKEQTPVSSGKKKCKM